MALPDYLYDFDKMDKIPINIFFNKWGRGGIRAIRYMIPHTLIGILSILSKSYK